VPLDGSLHSESILPLASQLAGRWQAELLALRVTDPTLGALEPMSSVLAESMVETGNNYLEDLQALHPDKRLQTHHQVGFPAPASSNWPPAKAAKWFLWPATDTKVSRTNSVEASPKEWPGTPCPTMLLRSSEANVQFRDILIPTDGSEESLSVARRIVHSQSQEDPT